MQDGAYRFDACSVLNVSGARCRFGRAHHRQSRGKGATKERPRQHRAGDNRATKRDQFSQSPQRHIGSSPW